jgi:hypothetical protein
MTLSPLLFHSPSSDGYVRVPEFMLARLTLVHVSSGIDEGLLADLRADAIDALDAGYTEWQGTLHPLTSQVTVGWDWYIEGTSGAFLIAWGDVRSNLMAVDGSGTDLGMVRTAQALELVATGCGQRRVRLERAASHAFLVSTTLDVAAAMQTFQTSHRSFISKRCSLCNRKLMSGLNISTNENIPP